MVVRPTGAVHEVGLDEMFFSATDARGVIVQANEVFVRLARRPREDLVGSAHNIIRHPAMPAGAFRAVWKMLRDGLPTCAYMLNLGGDGSSYWTLATIIPAGDGYLSVRSRPCRLDLLETTVDAYNAVRPQEETARAVGTSAAETAAIGEELLTKELRDRGYDSFESYLTDVLPAEAEARAELTGGLPQRPEATGVFRPMLAAINQLDDLVRTLAIDLGRFHAHQDRGEAHLARLRSAVNRLAAGLTEASHIVVRHQQTAPPLASAAPLLREQCDRLNTVLADLSARTADLAAIRTSLRFHVAMAQMQSEMLGRYVVSLIDAAEGLTTSDTAMRAVAQALETGLLAVASDLFANVEATDAVRTEIETNRTALRVIAMSVGKWRELVDRYRLNDELGSLLPAFDDALNAGRDSLTALEEHLAAADALTVGFDIAAVDDNLRRMLVMLKLA